MKFYVPRTLAADFDDFLKTDVPNQVGNFKLLHDWYEQFEDDYKEIVIRAEVYPDATKSRYENMDNNVNFRASLKSGIIKGDIVIAESGNVYLLDWEEFKETNNIPSRALRCNALITFYRNISDMVDEEGYLIHDRSIKTVAYEMPCNTYRYDGRPEWGSHEFTPGLVPNALTILNVQLNEHTNEIKIEDHFVYYNEAYTIVDIDRFGLKQNGESGVIKLLAKKEAGGNES